MNWRKSTLSGSQGGNCVEVLLDSPDGLVSVRDTKDRGGLALTFSPDAWRGFIAGVKQDQFATEGDAS